MILTHLVQFRFFGGASPGAAPTGFGGALPLGYYALQRGWSAAAPPVVMAVPYKPVWRVRRR